jgi:hypothetical protein
MLAVLACAPVLFAASYPRITFTKTFKGSTPEFYSVEISRDGTGIYKEAVDDPHPISFRLSDAATADLFDRLEKAGGAQKPVESNLKVANMGQKTIRFEDGQRKHEVSFNYSLDPNVQLIADVFERISETQQHFINLERSIRFDRLGVNKLVLQIEAALDRQRILGHDALLPLLDRVAKSDSFMHMTRERAARVAEALRNAKKPDAAGAGQAAAATGTTAAVSPAQPK